MAGVELDAGLDDEGATGLEAGFAAGLEVGFAAGLEEELAANLTDGDGARAGAFSEARAGGPSVDGTGPGVWSGAGTLSLRDRCNTLDRFSFKNKYNTSTVVNPVKHSNPTTNPSSKVSVGVIAGRFTSAIMEIYATFCIVDTFPLASTTDNVIV